jgi:Fe-S cluster assembly protein SufD
MASYTVKNINRLQVPTWNELGINEALMVGQIKEVNPYKGSPFIKEYPEIKLADRKGRDISATDAPVVIRDTKDYVNARANYRLSLIIPKGVKIEEPVILSFNLDKNGIELIDDIFISAEEGSNAVIVLRYSSAGDIDCFRCGYLAVDVAEGASIKLIKAQMMNDAGADASEVKVGKGGHAQIILAELGKGESISGCSIQLADSEALADLEGIYTANREKKLDLNYRVEYRGENTEGDITIKGVLSDHAHKVLRSTLDFIPGSSGARGREEENVLVLSPDAVNVSAPLLLCGEDDVNGQHATTTGKPDEAKLFYLMSRGISETEARKLIALAAFNPVLEQVEPEDLKEEMITFVREAIDNAV